MPEIDLSLLIYGLMIGIGAGAVGGMLAGLAGVGGGLIYMPVFYASMPGNHESVAIHVFASLVAVSITGYFSTRAHWRLGHIDNKTAKQLLPGLIIGAGLGLWCTLRLSEGLVLLALAGLDAWIAFDYGRKPRRLSSAHQHLVLLSGPIGFVSGTLGIGGGTMLVPLLRRIGPLRFAVGTSAMCGLMMALGAIAINVLLENRWHEMFASQWPFLIGAWLGIALILPKASNWSAHLHERLPDQTVHLALKYVFGILSVGLVIAALLLLFKISG